MPQAPRDAKSLRCRKIIERIEYVEYGRKANRGNQRRRPPTASPHWETSTYSAARNLRTSPGKKAAGECTPANSKASSADGPKFKKPTGQEKKKDRGRLRQTNDSCTAAKRRIQPSQSTGPRKTQSMHRLPPRHRYRQCGGQDQFVAALTATISSKGGRTSACNVSEYEHACVAAATVKTIGKGDNKRTAGKSYSAQTNFIRQTPYDKSTIKTEGVAKICKAGIETAKTQKSYGPPADHHLTMPPDLHHQLQPAAATLPDKLCGLNKLTCKNKKHFGVDALRPRVQPNLTTAVRCSSIRCTLGAGTEPTRPANHDDPLPSLLDFAASPDAFLHLMDNGTLWAGRLRRPSMLPRNHPKVLARHILGKCCLSLRPHPQKMLEAAAAIPLHTALTAGAATPSQANLHNDLGLTSVHRKRLVRPSPGAGPAGPDGKDSAVLRRFPPDNPHAFEATAYPRPLRLTHRASRPQRP